MPSPSDPENKRAAALPFARAAFLARYPRWLKVSAALLLLALIMATPFLYHRGPSVISAPTETAKNAAPGKAEKAAANQPDLPVATHLTGAPSLNEQDDRSIKLTPAPDPHITEDTAQGSLPRVSEDGRQPWQVYARPFNTADQRPRIAIVIADLGLARVVSDAAIARLPANVTLAFDAQSPVAGAWCGRARQDGHEVLLSVPMEPFDYPRSDPGPHTLLTSLPNSDNIDRLLWALRQGSGYVGITTLTGSRFTTDPEKVRAILEVLKKRGLMIFDARMAPHSVAMDEAHEMHVPAVAETVRIDQSLSPDAIDDALNQLEKTARLTGRATGLATAEPVVIDRLQAWFKDLPSRGIALAPVSAMTQ